MSICKDCRDDVIDIIIPNYNGVAHLNIHLQIHIAQLTQTPRFADHNTPRPCALN